MYTTDELKKIFNTEEFLLIMLCRLFFMKASRQEVADILAGSPIDYDKLNLISSKHGIRPLIYTVITHHSLDVDTDFVRQLKNHFEANQVHSFEKLLLIKKLTERFKAQGITAIPIKGVLYAANYYGNIALRETSDLDFLISDRDVEEVEKILIEYGYTEKMTVPHSFMDYYKKHFKEITYIIPSAKRKRGYTLEMHWRLLNKYMGSFPAFDFFKKGLNSFAVDHLQFEKLVPSYDLLSVVSNHFVKDLSVKFKYLVDVACLIQHSGATLDADLLRKIVNEHHCFRKTELGLHLVKKLLGLELEGWKIQETFPDHYSKEVLQVPFVLQRFGVLNPVFIKRSLRLQDKQKNKLHFLSRSFEYFLLPTPNDIRAFHKFPLPVLFLFRPFRLAGKQLRKSFRL